MDKILEALRTESAALRVRLAIFTAAEAALRKRVGKPIGKRLANDAQALIQAVYPENGHAWTSGGPNDFRYLGVSVGSQSEKFLLGWKAAEVPADTCETVKGWRDGIAGRLAEAESFLAETESLLSDSARLEALVNDCRLDLQDLQNAAERVKLSKGRLSSSLFSVVSAEFPAISDLTSRIY
jgi:hypothetical protein